MAATRALAFLGLVGLTVAVGSQTSDLQCLVQTQVGKSLTSDTQPDDGPHINGGAQMVLDAVVSPAMAAKAKDIVTIVANAFKSLVDGIQTPFFDCVGLKVHPMRDYNEQEQLQMFTGYLVGYAHVTFGKKVEHTISVISAAISTLGTFLSEDAATLSDSYASPAVAKAAVERAVSRTYHHIAEAIGKYYESLRLAVDHLPSKFLVELFKPYYPWLTETFKYDWRKIDKEYVDPKLIAAFAAPDWCAALKTEIVPFEKAKVVIGETVVVDLAVMRSQMEPVRPFVEKVCAVKSAACMTGLADFVDEMETSFDVVRISVTTLLDKIKKVATEQIGCDMS